MTRKPGIIPLLLLLFYPASGAHTQFDKGNFPALVIVRFSLNSQFESIEKTREELRNLKNLLDDAGKSAKKKNDIALTKRAKAEITNLETRIKETNSRLIQLEDTEAIRNYTIENIKKLDMFDVIPPEETDKYTAAHSIPLTDIYRPEYYRLFAGLEAGFILSGNVETVWVNTRSKKTAEYRIVLNLINTRTGRTYRSSTGTTKPDGRHIKNAVQKTVVQFFQTINLSPGEIAGAFIEAKYKTGDTGPGGGLIFFVKSNHSGGWRYLEAAPADIEIPLPWGFQYSDIWKPDAPGTQEAPGEGKHNTGIISAILPSEGTELAAAQVCAAYSNAGLRDWFLPSRDELNLMFRNLAAHGLGNFAPEPYWSSTQSSKTNAWYQLFNNGKIYPNGRKTNKFRVRPARAF